MNGSFKSIGTPRIILRNCNLRREGGGKCVLYPPPCGHIGKSYKKSKNYDRSEIIELMKKNFSFGARYQQFLILVANYGKKHREISNLPQIQILFCQKDLKLPNYSFFDITEISMWCQKFLSDEFWKLYEIQYFVKIFLTNYTESLSWSFAG